MEFIKKELKNISIFIANTKVIELGIAFIISTQINTITSSFVDNIFLPLIILIIGQDNIKNLDDLYFSINGIKFKYGNIILVLIKFILLIVIIYYIINILQKGLF
jgi:large conductance mechanosensitive channel